MLSRIDHVGIAVRDLDAAIRLYERRLGLRASGRERLEAEGIEIAMIPIGESRIELISPLQPDSRLHRFLDRRGEAVHHIAYAADDVSAALERARDAGAHLIHPPPPARPRGTRSPFVQPKRGGGVLTELGP